MLNAQVARYHKRVDDALAGPRTDQKIIRYFANTFMGNGHNGLSAIAKKEGLDLSNLHKGEFVIFVNSKNTALKMFAPGNVVAHLKMPGNGRLDLRTIALIPKFFNGTEIKYDKALEMLLRKELGIRTV